MSAKGRRNRAWEDEHLTGWWTPFRLLLRAFSSIPLAIVLLLYVALHATLASVPVGMLARIPTLLVYAASLLILLAILSGSIALAVRSLTKDAPRATRFLALFVSTVAVSAVVIVAWWNMILPHLRYSPETDTGLLLFKDFVHEHRSTTLRRMPGFEMTEPAFYAWWPMRLALVLFVINMVTATIRRIEFSFKNLGVLTVHTGIVIIALGSVFYQKFKLEGDTLMQASQQPGFPGAPTTTFFDREDVVLYVAQETGWDGNPRYEQRQIHRLPIYNDYNLSAGIPEDAQSLNEFMGISRDESLPNDGGRTLSIEPQLPFTREGREPLIDPRLKFRVIGFSPFAELEEEWFRVPEDAKGIATTPMRVLDLYAALPGTTISEDRAVRTTLMPTIPAQRVSIRPGVSMEYTIGMDETRWQDLQATTNSQFLNALVIEVPAKDFRTVVPASPGARFTLGDTGWAVGVKEIHETPPFPIITKGYEDADSSMVIVEITPPPHSDDEELHSGQPHTHSAFDRWVYHRFPEINQDLHPSTTGRPQRSAPNPAIRVSFIDATMMQVYLDERPDGSVRSIVRLPGGSVQLREQLDEDWLRDIVPNDEGGRIDLKLAQRVDDAIRVVRPIPLPEYERDDTFGKNLKAFIAVEVTMEGTDWSAVRWIPFAQYDPVPGLQTREIRTPDGKTLTLGFGRLQRPLPGFTVSLLDFQMIAYDHRGAPRDYQSVVRVESNPAWGEHAADIAPFEHLVKLNNPLRAPYHWDPQKSWFYNSFRRLSAGLNPDQFKLSQNGWDRGGWEESQRLVDQGVLERPRVNFTILGVGNNPGIHLIALGSILMGVGIPWAFYVKPWLVRREKARIAASVAAQHTKSTA
jgi:hypothetical protein